ncbi:MAG: hypothetical protein ACRDTD_02855 [Pseudonocardiaceae bacterium]
MPIMVADAAKMCCSPVNLGDGAEVGEHCRCGVIIESGGNGIQGVQQLRHRVDGWGTADEL